MQTTFVNPRKTERFHPSDTDLYVEASLSGVGTFSNYGLCAFGSVQLLLSREERGLKFSGHEFSCFRTPFQCEQIPTKPFETEECFEKQIDQNRHFFHKRRKNR